MKLTDEQVRSFHDNGYLVAEGVVTDADMAPAMTGARRSAECSRRCTLNFSDAVR